MTIIATYRVQCEDCHGWLADRPERYLKTLGSVTRGKTMAKEFPSEHDAEFIAHTRGWRMLPTQCPDCR